MKPVSATPAQALDDSAILRLAADQSVPLFRVVERSSALRPLVIVLAALPGLIALEHRDFLDDCAIWSLRALDVLNADSLGEGLTPGRTTRTERLATQPPLATWLTALVFQLAGTSRLPVPWIVSLLAGAGCVWWTFRLFSYLGGTRIGFWTAVLLSTHAGLLLAATSASPSALAMFFVLVLFDAWNRHIRDADGLASPWLMVAGVSAGLAMLSGGPLVLVGLAVLVIAEILRRLKWPGPSQRAVPLRGIMPWHRLAASLGVLLLTAFSVGGWWHLQAATSFDHFWANWWSGYDSVVIAIAGGQPATLLRAGSTRDILVHLLNITGPIIPLCLLGLYCCLSRIILEGDLQKRRPVALMLSWLLVGLISELSSPVSQDQRTLADLFFLFPVVGLAAIGLEDILQRRVPFWLVCVLVLSSTALFAIRPIFGEAGPYLTDQSFGWFLTAFFAFLTLLWGIQIWTQNREWRRWSLMAVLVAGQLCLAGLSGYFGLPPRQTDERRLVAVREDTRRMDELPSVDAIFFVSHHRPPPTLVYAVRSLRPYAVWHEIDRWDSTVLWKAAAENSVEQQSVLVVEWADSTRDKPLSTGTGNRKPVAVATPRYYRGHELKVFRIPSESDDKPVTRE